jgi:hypothetical protein
MITITQLEKEWGAPVEEWEGNCYGLACAAAKLMNRQGCKGAVPIYGHYQGEVHPTSMFHGHPIVQHGWVLMSNGDVLDPTRWAFEGRKPYLYRGPNDCYDEGGNAVRMAMIGEPPRFDLDDEIHNITPEMLPAEAWRFVEKVLNLDHCFGEDEYEPGDVTRTQLAWLANYDPRMMRGHATAIYTLLKELDFQAFIPIDNRTLVKRSPM